MRIVVVCLLFVCSACQTEAQGNRSLHVQEQSGGSVVTNLGFGVQVNKGSSLQRRWFVINDDSCPVQLVGAGITTAYQSSSIGGDYKFKPTGTANVSDQLSAIEIRFLLFDVWGEHMQTLSATEVTDLKGVLPLKDIGTWRAWENDVSEMMTVVAFVARARKSDGTIWEYDAHQLLPELAKIRVKLTEKELSPEREKPKS